MLKDSRFKTLVEPELDIVVWSPNAERASTISQLSEEMFKIAATYNLHLALLNYPSALLENTWPNVIMDQEQVTCLRSCLMKPEHLDWLDKILVPPLFCFNIYGRVF